MIRKRILILLLAIAFIMIQSAGVFALETDSDSDPSSGTSTTEEPASGTQTEEPASETLEENGEEPPVPKPVKKPAKVKGLTLVSQKGFVKLTWKSAKRAECYRVYRKYKGARFKLIKETKKTSYRDKTVKTDRWVTYHVRAMRAGNDGRPVFGEYSAKKKVFAVKTDPKKKMIALTFDDGPGPYTAKLIKALKKKKARATFFVCGYRIGSFGANLKKAYDIGCEIGNHSYNHPQLTNLSSSDIKSQISKTDKLIKKRIGTNAAIMRPPYGSVDTTVRKAVGKPLILWSVDTLDWQTLNVEATINSVLSSAEDGDIILMHDIHSTTVDAAVRLIPILLKRGFQLVTVSELARFRGIKLKKGSSYYKLD